MYVLKAAASVTHLYINVEELYELLVAPGSEPMVQFGCFVWCNAVRSQSDA